MTIHHGKKRRTNVEIRKTLKDILAEEDKCECGGIPEDELGGEKERLEQVERAKIMLKACGSFVLLFIDKEQKNMGGAVCCVAENDLPAMKMNAVELLMKMTGMERKKKDE
jgi:hypothetical protein